MCHLPYPNNSPSYGIFSQNDSLPSGPDPPNNRAVLRSYVPSMIKDSTDVTYGDVITQPKSVTYPGDVQEAVFVSSLFYFCRASVRCKG